MLALSSAPALASTRNLYRFQFSGSATPQGSFFPAGLAVDGAGNVYVADEANGVVDKFDASGNYVSQFDRERDASRFDGSGLAGD